MSAQDFIPYLQDPLVLIGFSLLVFFGFGRAILKAGIIPVLTQSAGYKILSRIILFGFILAVLIILLGFGLEYRSQTLTKAEQQNALNILKQELVGNRKIVGELESNINNIINNTGVVTEVLRHQGIPLLSTIFPAKNLDPDIQLPASLDLARLQLLEAESRGLINNELERTKFDKAAEAIVGTLERTNGAFESLSDEDGTRYVILDDAWKAQLPILRQVEIFPIQELQEVYQGMNLLRANYDVAVRHSRSYREALLDFLGGENKIINEQRLAAMLAAERLYVVTTVEFVDASKQHLADIEKIFQNIDSI